MKPLSQDQKLTPSKNVQPLRALQGAFQENPQTKWMFLTCLVAVFAASLLPAHFGLGTPVIREGLLNLESSVPAQLTNLYFAVAIFIIFIGALSDLFGRKLFLLVALCGLAILTPLEMIFFGQHAYRLVSLVDAACAVLVLPMVIASATARFKPFLRQAVYSMLFFASSIGTLLSPILIALFTKLDLLWITFVPTTILAVVAIFMSIRFIPESHAPANISRFSIFLNLAWILAVFALIFTILGRYSDTRSSTLIILVAAGFAIYIALYLVSARIFRTRRQVGSNMGYYSFRDLNLVILAGIIFAVAQGTFFSQVINFFQDVQNVTTNEIVLRLIPFVLSSMVGNALSIVLAVRRDARWMITIGLLLCALSMVGFIWLSPNIPYWALFIPVILLGFAVGISSPARTAVIQGATSAGLWGMGSAINTAIGMSGYGLGVIVSNRIIALFSNLVLGADPYKALSIGLAATFGFMVLILLIVAAVVWFGMAAGMKARLELLAEEGTI